MSKPLPEQGPKRGAVRTLGLVLAVFCLAVLFAPVVVAVV
jgi:hypothetical protein